MTKAEHAAMRAYPPQFSFGKRYAKRVQSEMVDTHAPIRKIFLKGYEQAEQDFALTWEDIRTITKILEEVTGEVIPVEFYNGDAISCYKEVLRKFKEEKK